MLVVAGAGAPGWLWGREIQRQGAWRAPGGLDAVSGQDRAGDGGVP